MNNNSYNPVSHLLRFAFMLGDLLKFYFAVSPLVDNNQSTPISIIRSSGTQASLTTIRGILFHIYPYVTLQKVNPFQMQLMIQSFKTSIFSVVENLMLSVAQLRLE